MLRKQVLMLSASSIALACSPAFSQTQLPAIVVTTPSPVKAKPKAEASPQTTRANTSNQPVENAAPSGPVALYIPADPTFAPVTVLTQEQLLRQPGQTLGQALGEQPGMAQTSFAAGASRPVIRGLSGFRVSTQENGIGTADVASLSDDHAVPIDPLAAGQVEVVRGPATLRYGSQAIGGVINATNSRIPDAIPQNGTRIESQGAVSSVDNGSAGSLLVEQGVGGFVLHADTFYRHADDYSTPEGKQANTSLDARGNSIGGSYVFRDGFFGVAYTTFNSTYFIPGVEAAESKNHIVLDQSKVTSRGELRIGDYGIEAVRTWFGATYYHHDEVDSVPVDAIGSSFHSRQYEARMEIQHMPVNLSLGEVRGAVGVQWTDRTLSGGGADGILLPEAKTRNNAAYMFEEVQLSKPLRFQIAGRIESSDVKGTASTFPASFLPPPDDPDTSPAAKTFVPKSASAGFLYEFSNSIVGRLTAQHVERAPDATELFYKGPHDSTGTFEIGNPNLSIERANTVEIGLKRAAGQFRFDLSAYHTNFGGFIFKRFTGAKCGDDFASCGVENDFNQIVYSQRNAEFTGAEAQAAYDIAPIWRGTWGVQGQYDFVHATFDDGSFVPKIPPHRLGGGLFYYDKAILARVTFLHALAQDEFAAFDTPTPGYNLLNAEISYTFKTDPLAKLSPEFTVGLRGENLLNEDIRNAVSFKKDEVLEPGRSVRLFGSVKLN